MNTLKKIPIFTLVLGILITIYAVLTRFIDHAFFTPSATVGRIVIGVGLIAFAALISLPPAFRKTNGAKKSLKLFEGVVLIAGALFGFILPIFKVDINIPFLDSNSGSFWFGLAFVLNGGIDLYLGTHGKQSTKGLLFVGKLTAVILGTYIYATNFVDTKITDLTFVLLLAVGIAFTLIGLLNLNKKK